MIVKAFTIKCLTNMHVGNGDVNFNIIDNEVERDPVTNYPTIHSSGIKGALREFFTVIYGKNSDIVNDIFGSEGKKESDGKSEPCVPGKIRFLSANMLALPMRASDGDRPFYMVTTKTAIEAYNKLAESLSCRRISYEAQQEEVSVEDVKCSLIKLSGEFHIDNAALMDDRQFDSANNQVPLPVVARNKLENGRSTNLWYEEIVPHETVFTFFVVANDADKSWLDILVKDMTSIPVQFGGNATIGYGLCEIREIGGGADE